MISVLNPSAFPLTLWLLRHGASPVYVNPDTGQTALHCACSADNVQAALALLRGGAPADVPDAHGRTPLHLAAASSSEYLTSKLLKYVALQAAQRGGSAACGDDAMGAPIPLPLLPHHLHLDPALAGLPRDTLGAFSAQAALNRQDLGGYTPLMVASEHGREGIVGHLLSRNASVHARSKVGHTALVLADWYGHIGTRETRRRRRVCERACVCES